MASGTIAQDRNKATGTLAKGVEGGTLTNTALYKIGNIVSVGGQINSLTSQDAGSHTWFTIPDGFRPKEITRCFGTMNITGVGIEPVMFNVYTNGEVTAGYSSSKEVTMVNFSATYPI